jgi:hypothetical protein
MVGVRSIPIHYCCIVNVLCMHNTYIHTYIILYSVSIEYILYSRRGIVSSELVKVMVGKER